MIRNCGNCTKPYDAKTKRSQFCSKRCKLQFNRNNTVSRDTQTLSFDTQSTENDTVNRDTQSTVSPTSVIGYHSKPELTKTDQTFEDHAPGFYNFGDTVREGVCLICGNRFKTRLSLLKTCSYQHYSDLISKFSNT